MSDAGFSAHELELLRNDTPAFGRYAHFAHGSASLPPWPVFAAQQAWIESERTLGSQRAAEHHADALADVKASVGRLVNTQAHRIALLDSASRSWSSAMSAALNGGGPFHVITTDLEYGSNAIYLLLAAKRAALSFSVLPILGSRVALSQLLAEALDATPVHLTPIVSLPVVASAWGIESVPNNVGQQIAHLVRERDGFFFLDASHAVGQVPVDVDALGCDVLVFPARKWLRGPKGVGILCLSERALDRFDAPDSTGVSAAHWSHTAQAQPYADARRFEAYEFNPGLHLALKAACDYALATGPYRIAAHNRIVRAKVAALLKHRLGWKSIEGDASNATALMTYRVPDSGSAAEPLVDALWRAGVNASIVTAEFARWTLESVGTQALVRLTPHYLTDEGEIEQLASALEAFQRQAGSSSLAHL